MTIREAQIELGQILSTHADNIPADKSIYGLLVAFKRECHDAPRKAIPHLVSTLRRLINEIIKNS